jgi:putative ABC transport system substrate-binding protein
MNSKVVLLIVTIVLTTAALGSAQQPKKVARIGFLGNSTPELEANLVGPFREGLRDLGYIEKKSIFIEYRWIEGKYERLPTLINELLSLPVDLIVTAGTPASLAVKKATDSVPLVMIAVGDPVGTGLIKSLHHPGGNATGVTSIASDLEGKRIELLREVAPKVSYVAALYNPVSPFQVVSEKELQAAAQGLRIKILSLPVKSLEDIEAAFGIISKERPEALMVLADRFSWTTGLASWSLLFRIGCPGCTHTRSWSKPGA